MSRIPMSRIVPGVLPLAGVQVTRLATSWVSAGHWRQAWSDIEILAQRFLEGDPDENGMATLAWHHLLLAVGNFKRRGGLIVPARLRSPRAVGTCPDEITIPGAAGELARLACEESATWPRLTETPGLGVPTATTVLSALWPSRHVIIDTRDTRAALGLGAGTLWDVEGLDDAEFPDISTDDRYWALYREWFRPTILATAGSGRPLDVEKALFHLDELTMPGLPGGRQWTWSAYRDEALRHLDI